MCDVTSLFARITATLFLTLAVVMLGFGHASSAQSSLDPDLSAFIAAGGDLSDICGLPGSGDADGRAECQACRIADSAAIVANAASPLCIAEVSTQSRAAIAERVARTRDLDPARLTRAPPQA